MNKTVAILDDELISRNQINSIIQKIPQLEVVMNTSDPYELLNYLEVKHLDLIILDMNMPIMTGLEFLEQLQVLDRSVKVLVLSGYADFAYAKGSVKFGVTDYILKHELDEESLRQSLRQINFLSEEKIPTDNNQQISDLTSFFRQQPSANDKEQLRSWYPNFIQEKMQALVVVPVEIGKKVWDKKAYKRKSAEVLEQILQDYKGEKIQLITTITTEGELFVLFSFAKMNSQKDIMDLFNSLMIKLKNTASRLLDVKLFLMTNHLTGNLSEVLSIFNKQSLILNRLFFCRANELVIENPHEQFVTQVNQEEVQLSIAKIYFQTRYFNQSELLKSIGDIFDYIRKKHFARDTAIELIAQVEFQISLGMSDALQCPIENQLQINYYQKYDTLNKIEADFTDTLIQSIDNYRTQLFAGKDAVVQQAIDYIHQNFTQEISLKTCSEGIHLNYSYLSRVFGQQWSCSFSKYVNEVRLALAKLYLSSQQYSVSQVAELCGYTNYNYFFRVFKELTDCSPNAYSEQGKV